MTLKYTLILILFTNLYAPIEKDHLFHLDYDKLWQSILEVESNNLHTKNGKIVVSHKGAIGKSQLMPDTFKDIIRWSRVTHLEYKDISNKQINLWAGEWYFHHLYYDLFYGYPYLAISAYNGGHNNNEFMSNYVRKVLDEYKKRSEVR